MVLALCFAVLVAWEYGVFTNRYPQFRPNQDVPKIIHLMYFPWDKNQNLLKNQNDFDRTYCDELRKAYPDMLVMMWTLPLVHSFCDKHYPGLWEMVRQNAVRPTQLVDLFRWLVVYHFGGLYLQYDSKLYVHPEQLLPSQGFDLRLYTEFVWVTPVWQWLAGRKFAIRNYLPEEKWRIMNQLFAATPKHPYVWLTWTSILERMCKWKPKCDYDILFIGANAFVSELYDKVGQKQKTTERINFWQTRHLVKVSNKGSWRLDHSY